jgi:hypothetical protein
MAELGNCTACLQTFHDSVIVPATPTLAGELHVCGGSQAAVGKASFFAPRVVVLTGPPPTLSVGASVATGAPGGMQGVSPSEESGRTVPPGAQYDLITDLLDANMFKVYVDMLKSDKQRVKAGQPAKFGYLPMIRAVATLGVLNAESFCERVLSCVKLVVSDLHVSLKPSEIRMLVMIQMNRGFMEYMRKTYPNTLVGIQGR